jgi:hypothetical protein
VEPETSLAFESGLPAGFAPEAGCETADGVDVAGEEEPGVKVVPGVDGGDGLLLLPQALTPVTPSSPATNPTAIVARRRDDGRGSGMVPPGRCR